jgi:diadenosine tetraphosphate (Ap4A) HIT family hydrolase
MHPSPSIRNSWPIVTGSDNCPTATCCSTATPWCPGLSWSPRPNLGNLLDLPIPQRDGVLADCKRVSDYLTGVLACPKVNVAWIGNLVPQLHVHLIGRRPDDSCWPKPVWGNLTQSRDYGAQEVDAIRAALLDI